MGEKNSNELQHYGVPGMRWGVRRASRKLSKASDKAHKDKAVATLKKHKEKGEAKIKKLEKQAVKLEKRANDTARKNEAKAKGMKYQASVTRNAAYGRFITQRRAQKKLYEADRMDARADMLLASSEKAKAKVKHNKMMQDAFKTEISKIDKALVESGKRYLKG